jgi:thiol-disulfide isomerase/thioredoxin
MPITQIEFTDLEKQISTTSKSAIDLLATDLDKVYVVAITREGCPSCEKQEPRLKELAKNLSGKHRRKLVFIRIFVRQSSGDVTESLRAKDTLHHYFYPTNIILYRTKDRGVVELYKNIEPRMSELKRNIETALKTIAGP